MSVKYEGFPRRVATNFFLLLIYYVMLWTCLYGFITHLIFLHISINFNSLAPARNKGNYPIRVPLLHFFTPSTILSSLPNPFLWLAFFRVPEKLKSEGARCGLCSGEEERSIRVSIYNAHHHTTPLSIYNAHHHTTPLFNEPVRIRKKTHFSAALQ